MKDVQRIVKTIAGLKPIPRIVNKVLALAEDPQSSMSDVGDVICYDAMASANLLKAANSAYYRRANRFDSVHQAIVFMGMDEVVDLVLLTNSARALNHPQNGYGMAQGVLWRYSVVSALIAREIAVQKGITNPHLIFTAALLKDIGKVVIEQYVHDGLEAIKSRVAAGNYSFREAEKKVIGLDHAELGGMVARVWQFNQEMVDIIANHHQPHCAQLATKEAMVVYTSDVICMMMGVNTGHDGLAYRFHRETLEALDITADDMQRMIAGFSDEINRIDALIA